MINPHALEEMIRQRHEEIRAAVQTELRAAERRRMRAEEHASANVASPTCCDCSGQMRRPAEAQ
jgi:hypothetical protein